MEKVQIEREFPWDKRKTKVKKENIPLPRSLLLRPRLGSPVPSRSQVELKDAFRLPYKLLSWKTKAIKHTASCHSLMTTTGSQPEDRSPEETQAETREMKGSGAPWKLCHMEAIPEEQGGEAQTRCLSCPQSMGQRESLILSTWEVEEWQWSWCFEDGVERGNPGMQFCQDRIKTVTRKRILLMKEQEPFLPTQKTERKHPAQRLNFAWKAKKNLGTRGTNNISAQGKDLW